MKGQWARARKPDSIKESLLGGGVDAPALGVGPASHRGLKWLMSRGVGAGASWTALRCGHRAGVPCPQPSCPQTEGKAVTLSEGLARTLASPAGAILPSRPRLPPGSPRLLTVELSGHFKVARNSPPRKEALPSRAAPLGQGQGLVESSVSLPSESSPPSHPQVARRKSSSLETKDRRGSGQ